MLYLNCQLSTLFVLVNPHVKANQQLIYQVLQSTYRLQIHQPRLMPISNPTKLTSIIYHPNTCSSIPRISPTPSPCFFFLLKHPTQSHPTPQTNSAIPASRGMTKPLHPTPSSEKAKQTSPASLYTPRCSLDHQIRKTPLPPAPVPPRLVSSAFFFLFQPRFYHLTKRK